MVAFASISHTTMAIRSRQIGPVADGRTKLGNSLVLVILVCKRHTPIKLQDGFLLVCNRVVREGRRQGEYMVALSSQSQLAEQDQVVNPLIVLPICPLLVETCQGGRDPGVGAVPNIPGVRISRYALVLSPRQKHVNVERPRLFCRVVFAVSDLGGELPFRQPSGDDFVLGQVEVFRVHDVV